MTLRNTALLLCAALLPAGAEESERTRAFLRSLKGAAPAAKAAAVARYAGAWDAETAPTLLRLLKPKEDPDVLVAVAEAAGARAGADAAEVLKAALAMKGDDAWRVRATAASALLKRGEAGDFDLAMTAAADPDGRVLQWLCDGLGASKDPRAVEALRPFLEHKDWRVRSAAVGALGTKSGSDPAFAMLTARLPLEEGRLLGDLQAALKRLTGQSLGPDPKAWSAWAAAKRESGGSRKDAADAGDAGFEEAGDYGAPVTYHGVTSYSKRVIFVFDRTGSMTQNDNIGKEKKHLCETLAALGKPPPGKAEEKYAKASDRRKTSPVQFNILMFSDGKVEAWQQALVPATEENKKSAVAFVQRQAAVGWTNTWTAMKAALDMARGAPPPRANEPLEEDPGTDLDGEGYAYGKGEADTIFLLSDGAPTKPPGNIPDDWAAIADRIRDYNRTKRCVIHTVGIGAAPEVFMRRVADENGGTFIKVP